MNRVPTRDVWLPLRIVVGLVALSLMPQAVRAQDPPQAKPESPAELSRRPWRAFGLVTDGEGRPMGGVQVLARCGGGGTLRGSGIATSGDDGRYELMFGPGIDLVPGRGSIYVGTIRAQKPGWFEQNLNRQGECVVAAMIPGGDRLKQLGRSDQRLFLPDRPHEINFVMRPAGRVAGRLVDERGQPLAESSVALTGAELPPMSNAMCAAVTDEQGRFALEDIPTTYRFQFEVREADAERPYHGSWASAALRFERPERGDLRARFGHREIRLRKFVLRVAGPGVGGPRARAVAANAGVLELTADVAGDVEERTDTLLTAKAAVLTLRNQPGQDQTPSLINESVPSAPANRFWTRLSRTRQNEAGEFTISFENPRELDLERGKHQVVLQVFVGVSRKPVRQRIFRQLDIQKGRYEVPVKVPPELIDDSQVVITFLTIQPDHNALIRSFFDEGELTGYQGIKAGDGASLPTGPIEVGRGE